ATSRAPRPRSTAGQRRGCTSRTSRRRLLRLHPGADVALMDAEVGIDLLHLDREHERRGGVHALQVFADIREHHFGDAPAYLRRASLGDPDSDVDETVGRIVVGDAVLIAAVGARAQAAELGGAGAHHGRVQRLEQGVDLDLLLEIGGILADDVRHGRVSLGIELLTRGGRDPTSSRREVERGRAIFAHEGGAPCGSPVTMCAGDRAMARYWATAWSTCASASARGTRPWSTCCGRMRCMRRALRCSAYGPTTRSPRSSCCRRWWRRKRSSASASTTPTAISISTIPT